MSNEAASAISTFYMLENPSGMLCGTMRDSSPATHQRIPRNAVIVLVLFAAACAIYLPDVGHGFVKDDFGWIRDSRLSSWAEIGGLFGAPSGFFRPAVS